MSFTALPSNLQTILLYNYEVIGKNFLLFIMFAFSLIYLFYWRPYKQKETIFFSIAFLRVMIWGFSTITLILTPYFVFFLSPQYELYKLTLYIITVHGVATSLWLLIFVLDIWHKGIFGLLELGGLNTYSKAGKKFAKWIKERGFFGIK